MERHLRRRPSGFLVAALGLASIYALLWGYIDYLLERAFNLHIWDAGANYVLTNMTAQPDLDYGHLTSAPQNLIYLAFTPLTRAFPDPMTLVFAEDILMGVGGAFIYLIAAHVWQNRGLGLFVEGLYLFNYALYGAPFYPNHYEILFSVFFPIAYYLHLRGRDGWAAVFVFASAICSSLGAVTAGLFVVLLLGPRFLQELQGQGTGLARFFRDHWSMVAAGLASLAAFVLPFFVVGSAITLSYAHLAGSPASPDLAGGATYSDASKLLFIGMLVLPFLPTLPRSRYVLLALPYLTLTILAGFGHYSQFWYQYAYTVGAILFIAWIEALRFRYAKSPWPRVESPTGVSPASGAGRWHLPDRARRHAELSFATATIVVLGFFILPYSPGNTWAGNYDSLPFHNVALGTLTKVTPYDQALWQMAQEIPLNASVLIEEDMPMLTNRAIWYEPGSYNGQAVEYALADPTMPWFTFSPPLFIGPYPVPMLTWVNDLYDNRSFGVVEEYQGAALLEANYTGSTASFVPYTNYEPGVAFVGPNATYPTTPAGSYTIHDLTNGSFAFQTEGAMILPPGTYTMTFLLSSSSSASSNRLEVGLWTNSTAPEPIVTHLVTGTNLSGGRVTAIRLTFDLTQYYSEAYFGAQTSGWAGSLTLGSVFLNQTAPH